MQVFMQMQLDLHVFKLNNINHFDDIERLNLKINSLYKYIDDYYYYLFLRMI